MRRHILSLMFLSACASRALAQCPNGYGYQRAVTVNAGKVPSTQTNFPMLMLNPTGSLKTAANGGHVQNANGYDIIVVDSGGSTLPFELVGHGTADTTYSATSGNAQIWVNVASISNGTTIYLCYGNAGISTYQGNDAGVWNSNYKRVYHLESLTAESTASGATATNSGITGTAALIGNGAAANTGMSLTASDAGLPTSGPVTLSVWLQTTSPIMSMIFANYGTASVTPHGQVYLGLYNIGDSAQHEGIFGFEHIGSINVGTQANINDGAWHHLAGASDGSTATIYLDGVPKSSKSATSYMVLGGADGLHLNTAVDGTQPFIGNMDEMHVLSTALSANWIQTEYNNQSNPAAFYTVGGETTLTVSTTVTIAPGTIPNGHAGNITLTLSGTGTVWTGSTVFNLSGVANVTKVSQNVASATSATIVVTTGAGAGTLAVQESVTGTSASTVTVAAATLSPSPGSGSLNSVQTVTLTGGYTMWTHESVTGLFTLSGGTGASVGTPTVTADGAATVAVTTGTASGTLTITDTSTGATTIFVAGSSPGGTCGSVWSQ